MTAALNHTIVFVRDKQASAEFLATILGLPIGEPVGYFVPVAVANGVTLDFADFAPDVQSQHYAFLVDEGEFDGIFERIIASGAAWFADPNHTQPNEINHRRGGRGVYFVDPSGHNMEVLTRA
jgi:catechol 2,3-dioxygenase-like lactoylglutathione lyase family enzyme